MTKKVLFLCLIILIAGGAVFAQGFARSSVAVQFTLIGASASYEFIISPHFSLLGEVAYTTMVLINEFSAAAKARWYPFGKAFYLDLGLGYCYGRGYIDFTADMVMIVLTLGYWLYTKDWDEPYRGGFLIQPGLGWKIDIGKPDGFVLPISMGLDIKIGEYPDFFPYFRIGIGYSF